MPVRFRCSNARGLLSLLVRALRSSWCNVPYEIVFLVTASVFAFAQTRDRKGNQKTGITEEATAMKTHAKATFDVKAWDEKPYNEMNGLPKLTRVTVTKSYQGDVT